ncbi:B12-binding domain-containing protein [Chloroflexota bacterium]
MKKEEIFEDLFRAIVDLDEDKGEKAAAKLIEEKLNPVEGIEKGLSKGMKTIGERFDKLEIYLPEMMMAADVFSSVMGILKPHISTKSLDEMKQGTMVIGTVKGDIHAIGKDIVAMLLETVGFTVYNLGTDIATSTFIEEARKVKADIIGLSSLLTSTMPAQKDIIDILKEKGERDRYSIIVGGAPTSQAWSDEIGADGYGETAESAVSLALELMAKKGKI